MLKRRRRSASCMSAMASSRASRTVRGDDLPSHFFGCWYCLTPYSGLFGIILFVVEKRNTGMQSRHFRDWRALSQFHPNATVRLLNTTFNPWSGGSHGDRMWNEVLVHNPVSTVHELEKRKDELRIPDEGWGSKGHLGWLFTWINKPGFPFVEIDGQVFDRAPRPSGLLVPADPAPAPHADERVQLPIERVDALFEAVDAIRREIRGLHQ
jgi:hypothetical protein